MKLFILAVGHKMPSWISDGFSEFSKRMPAHMKLQLKELQPEVRSRQNLDSSQLKASEATRIRKALPSQAVTIAMEVTGKNWSTEQLAGKFSSWLQSGRDLCFIIGGADGLDDSFSQSCDFRWSLGAITLPHGLVRVILAEQLYRATTILSGHPYHRG